MEDETTLAATTEYTIVVRNPISGFIGRHHIQSLDSTLPDRDRNNAIVAAAFANLDPSDKPGFNLTDAQVSRCYCW